MLESAVSQRRLNHVLTDVSYLFALLYLLDPTMFLWCLSTDFLLDLKDKCKNKKNKQINKQNKRHNQKENFLHVLHILIINIVRPDIYMVSYDTSEISRITALKTKKLVMSRIF